MFACGAQRAEGGIAVPPVGVFRQVVKVDLGVVQVSIVVDCRGQRTTRGRYDAADLRIGQRLAQNLHTYQPATAEHQQGLACVVVMHVVTPVRGAWVRVIAPGFLSVKRSGAPLASG